MSHFSVTVRLSSARLLRHLGSVDRSLAEMFAPYEESTKDRKFLAWRDQEDEFRKEYTESANRIKAPDGTLHSPWDERFRKPGEFGIGAGTHFVPDGYLKIEVPFRELFETFDDFVAKWHESARDEEKGRFGYWHNPNAKWDYFVVGGRYTGQIFVKDGHPITLRKPESYESDYKHPGPCRSDIARLEDIDMDRVAEETRKRAADFYAEWSRYCNEPASRRDDPFDGPRSRALSLGLLRVEETVVEAGPGEIVDSWANANMSADDKRRGWSDVLRVIDEPTFRREFEACFCPLITYAVLDDDGWHAPGRVGWFGSSSAEGAEKAEHNRTFVDRYIKTTGPDDLLVIVDCHI